MSGFDFFGHLYNLISRHRLVLFLVAAAIIVLSIMFLSGIQLSEDIKSMLPDNQKDFKVDFELLQRMPFMHKVIINLKSKSKGDVKELIEVADRLAKAMTPPFFTRVITGPEINQDMDIYNWLIRNLPNLSTDKDLEDIESELTRGRIRDQLTDNYNSLFSPEGWFLKNFIKIDPLNLKAINLKKLTYLNIIPNVRLQDNHFVDAGGENVLLIAETNVDITDSANAEKMLDQLNVLAKNIVPQHIDMSVLSAHNYTVANAETIKKDLFIVLTLSSLSVIILYIFFLKSWRAFLVLLISFSSFSIALVSVSLIYKAVSAITIGFGSVLLGLSDDLSLHVYFALRPGKAKDNNHDPLKIMAEVSRPVLFGGVITVCTFSLLMLSSLPGQRQLGAFSIIGVMASLTMSLILLPHMMQVSSAGKTASDVILKKRRLTHPSIVIGIWILLLIIFAWQGRHITFNGDLNSINYVPKELHDVELMIKDTWGDLRGHAMVLSEGRDLESALEINDDLFRYLKQNAGDKEIISISQIVPSKKAQQSNQKAWNNFWSVRKDQVRLTLEKEGKALGFSVNAFDPFFSGLNASPSPILPEDLNIFGVRDVLDSMIMRSDGKVSILTLVPDTAEMKVLMAQAQNIIPGARFVSQTHFSDMIRNAISHDFIRFIIGAFCVIVLLLVLLFRNIKKVLLSLVPVVTGMIFMFGVMSWFKISFNIFNIISSILIIGTGVDYGIFMVCKSSEDYEHDTDIAVLLSGLTTVTGIGALIFARHPALYSIGITVLLGIGAAIPSAMFVIPAFYRTKDNGPDRETCLDISQGKES
jgi:predicted exporter